MAETSLYRSPRWNARIRQFTVFLCFCTSTLSIGASIGYTSPAVPAMKSPGNKFPVSDEQGALIGSIFFVGAILGSIVAVQSTQRLGHKTVIMVSITLMAIGWLLIICANGVAVIYIGRILTGISFGIGIIVPQLYASDIATPDVRGILFAMGNLTTNLGCMYAYSLGIILSWRWLAVSIQTISLLAIVTFVFVPDSPRWDYSQGRIEAAIETLQRLRGKDVDISTELTAIKISIEKQNSAGAISMKDLASKTVIIPMAIVIVLFICQQFMGIAVIVINLSEMMGEANSGLDPNQQSVIVSAIDILATIPLMMLIDRLGRRIALITSFSVCVVMLITLGINDVLKVQDPHYVAHKLVWLPILCISVFQFGSNIGLPIPFLLMIELYPSRTKVIACSVTLVLYHGSTFLVPSIYVYIVEGVGYYGMYWIFAGFGTIAIIFVFFVVPETKGQSLEQIEDMLAQKMQDHNTHSTTYSQTRL